MTIRDATEAGRLAAMTEVDGIERDLIILGGRITECIEACI